MHPYSYYFIKYWLEVDGKINMSLTISARKGAKKVPEQKQKEGT